MKMISWNVLILSFSYITAARVAAKCSAPPEYAHTALVKKYIGRWDFDSGEKVYYNCAENFTPIGGFRVVRCLDGNWTKLTLKCEKKSCGNAGELPNGQFEYEGNSYIGEKVFAVCSKGYSLKGLDYMVCKESGWTGEFPACEEAKPTCAAPAVANSVRPGRLATAHRLGDTVNVTCGDGFQLDGARNITCGPGGRWRPRPPRCLPSIAATQSSAKPGACGVPQSTGTSKANLLDKYASLTSFAPGDRVYYVCGVGYAAGGSRYRECRRGRWTRLLLRCTRKLCGTAGEILNGAFMYTGVKFGDVARAVCDVGHRLVGLGIRNCMSKGWDGRVPTCEAVQCDVPPEVPNAEMRGNHEQSYPYRSTVGYRCLTGTLTGSRDIWCTEDGTWSSPPPTCEEITCPPPNVPGAYWSAAQDGRYQEGDTISVECKPGYTSTGRTTVTCGSNGRWSPGLPTCSPIPRRVRWNPSPAVSGGWNRRSLKLHHLPSKKK